MEVAETFVQSAGERNPALFYLRGHSYEFEKNDNWNVIENFAEYMGNRVFNPTNTTLYFEIKKEIYCVSQGSTIEL